MRTFVVITCLAFSIQVTSTKTMRADQRGPWPSLGSSSGTLDSLYTHDYGYQGIADVAVGNCGDVYVLEIQGDALSRIRKFRDATPMGGWVLQGAPPALAITTDRHGDVYVSLDGGCGGPFPYEHKCIYVLKYTANGDSIGEFSDFPSEPWPHSFADVAVEPDSTIWLLEWTYQPDNRRILTLNADFTLRQVLSQPGARALVADDLGSIYVSTPGAITKIVGPGSPQTYPPLDDFTVAGDVICGYKADSLFCYRTSDGRTVAAEPNPFSMISLTYWFPWIRLDAQDESKIYAVGHNPEGQEPAVDWLLRYNRPTAAVRFPTSPQQSCSTNKGPCATSYVIERRHDLPATEGVVLYFDLPAWQLCGGKQPTSIRLFPRSGTGPVFPVNLSSHTAYFRMDNLTSVGFYDLAIDCGGYLDTIQVNVEYRGYQGYTPSGVLTNSLTGNVIRGAKVSIWQDIGGGSFQWFDGTVAGDGTYFFDVPPGTYKVLVQYDLAGEQWRGPFEVNSPIPYEDIALVPVTQDSDPPIVQLSPEVNGEVTGLAMDPAVGLAVAEIVPDSMVNVDCFIEYFEQGDNSVAFSVRSADGINPSYVKLLFIDQLGNSTEQEIRLGSPTDVSSPLVPSRLVLEQNHPNPFNPTTTISYAVPSNSHVSLRIYDVRGTLVRTLVDTAQKASRYSMVWDGHDDRGGSVSSGVYFAMLRAGEQTLTNKLVLLK